MDTMRIVHVIATVLVIVGALNWLSIGVLDYNFVDAMIGPMYAKHVYTLVGVAGLLLVVSKVMKYTSGGKAATVEAAITA
jgi:uncharacterized protein